MTQKIRSIIGQTLIMCGTDELFTILTEEDKDSKIHGVAAPANSKSYVSALPLKSFLQTSLVSLYCFRVLW